MKWILIALLVFPVAHSVAQNLDKQYKWVKIAPTEIPVKSKMPYYDISVPLDNEVFTKEKLQENANYYFEKVFSSTLVKKDGKHKYSGIGNYSFNISKNDNPQGVYTVNYILDIVVKKGYYNVVMHNFTIEHLGIEVNIPNRFEASKSDMLSKQILDFFHKYNVEELKKVYNTMSSVTAPSEGTVSI